MEGQICPAFKRKGRAPYLYVNLATQRKRASGSDNMPLNEDLMFRPARGALGRAISDNCFLTKPRKMLAQSVLYCNGLYEGLFRSPL